MLFLAPLLLLAYPLDWFFSSKLIQAHYETGELEVSNAIYSGKLDCDIAIYGSSRAWVHFNSQMIQDSLQVPVYNFGIDGHNFWLQYLRHLEYLKHNKKPHTIILSVDAFTLQKRSDLYQPEQFLPVMLWNQNVYNYTHSYEGYSIYDYCIPLLRYVGQKEALEQIWHVMKGAAQPQRHKGFAGMDMTWNKDLEMAQAKGEKYTIQFDKPTMRLFERFLIECKKAKIDVVLVYAPEYTDGQHFVSNRKQLMDYYRKQADQNHIPFLDFSSDALCDDQSLFYNSSHLNKTGADLFTRKFIHVLKRRIIPMQKPVP